MTSGLNYGMVTIMLLLCLGSTVTSMNNPVVTCPTWFIPTNDTEGNITCECGSNLNGRIRCNPATNSTQLLITNCMTYSNSSRLTVVGSCPYSTVERTRFGYIHDITPDVSQLNWNMCHPFHSRGQLCGECEEGYAPAILSYSHACVDCKHKSPALWLLFIALEFLPVTVFFIVVVLFRLGATSGPLNGFIFFSQVYSLPVTLTMQTILTKTTKDISSTEFSEFTEIIHTLYSFWNLNFFTVYVSGLCFSDSITTLGAFALEYLRAVYVLFLTIVSFVVMELYDHGVKPIVVLWKPFRMCSARFRRHWDHKDSLIDAFGTFLVLCYTRLTHVSIRILDGAFLFDIKGRKSLVFYFDGSVRYFGEEHAPYAILAIITLATATTIPPLILIFYQTSVFHACLGRCKPRFQNGLKVFVDSFQGCFKDRYRFVAGAYFVLRIVLLVANIDSIFGSYFGRHAIILVLIVTALAFALLRPYKNNAYNAIDALHFGLLGVIFLLLYDDLILTVTSAGRLHLLIIASLLAVLPLFYLIGLMVYWIAVKKGVFLKLKANITKQGAKSLGGNRETVMETTQFCYDIANDSFPDRLVHPKAYHTFLSFPRPKPPNWKENSSCGIASPVAENSSCGDASPVAETEP